MVPTPLPSGQGGVTIGDRLRAGEAIPSADFLPNAAGLADALTELHAAGIIHGGISADTILFSAAHPAKLSGFGRGIAQSQVEDTRRLAEALTLGIVGGPTDLPPSQVAPDLPVSGRRGTRREHSPAIWTPRGWLPRCGPRRRPAAPRRLPPWSWRWVVVGAVLLSGCPSPRRRRPRSRHRIRTRRSFFRRARPQTFHRLRPHHRCRQTEPSVDDAQEISVIGAVYDPFGDGGERNADLALSTDGNESTGWRTERYFDPLQTIKPGVGATFSLRGHTLNPRARRFGRYPL